MAEYGPLGSSSQANIFLTISFALIYILFRPQVTRRLLHRPLLVYRMPNLLCIDGIPVSNDEKTKAELYFLEQQVCCQFRAPATNCLLHPRCCQMFVLLTSRLGYTVKPIERLTGRLKRTNLMLNIIFRLDRTNLLQGLH